MCQSSVRGEGVWCVVRGGRMSQQGQIRRGPRGPQALGFTCRAVGSHGKGGAQIQCVFTFTAPWRVLLSLRWEYVYAALAGDRAVRRGRRQLPRVEGHPQGLSGEHLSKQKARMRCWITLPVLPTRHLGHRKGDSRVMGPLLGVMLAKNRDVMSVYDRVTE